MWRTSCGDRTLEGAEAKLFAESLWDLIEVSNLDECDDYQVGIKVFDRLTYGQKVSVLSIIGNGLLRKEVPPVKLTAVVEGAIAAIFEHLKTTIIVEMDEPEFGTTWRNKVVVVRKEVGGEDIPSPKYRDLEEWEIEIGELEDRILWDADFDYEDLYMDDFPERTEMLKTMARISQDYYLEITEDLEEREIKIKLRELKELCRSIVESV